MRKDFSLCRFAVLCLLAIPLLCGIPAKGSIPSLGAAAGFGIFDYGSSLSVQQVSLSNPQSGIFGDVALGPYSKQNFSDGFITGTLYVDPTANNSHANNVKNSLGGSSPPPVVIRDLSQAVTDAQQASANFAALTPTMTLGNVSSALTINGNGGLNVISMASLQYTDASDILTLNGTANDFFVLNVPSGGIWKMTHAGSAIVAGGGVTADHIIWNILGTGQDLSFSGNPTALGTFLALDRNVQLDPGDLFGSIISGGSISISSGARVHETPFSPTPVPEPASCTLLGLVMMAGLASRVSGRFLSKRRLSLQK